MSSSSSAVKPIAAVAAAALTEWIEASGITQGAIFLRIRGRRIAEPLKPMTVRAIVKRRPSVASLTGVAWGDPPEHK